MGVIDWLLSMRKKPLEERRRFVAISTIVVTASITALWLLLTVTVGPLKIQDATGKESVASPMNINLPEIPPFPEFPKFPGRN